MQATSLMLFTSINFQQGRIKKLDLHIVKTNIYMQIINLLLSIQSLPSIPYPLYQQSYYQSAHLV
jgi:hypothetical protein